MKIAMLSVHSCPLGKVGGESTGGMSVYIREVARESGGEVIWSMSIHVLMNRFTIRLWK